MMSSPGLWRLPQGGIMAVFCNNFMMAKSRAVSRGLMCKSSDDLNASVVGFTGSLQVKLSMGHSSIK